MLYRAAADCVVIVHIAFVLFVVLGGLLVLRWPKLAWVHVPAVAWAAFVEFSGWICPLTPLEVALSRRAGEAGYAGDFIEHYVAPVLYPDGLTREFQTALGVAVVLVNAMVYVAAMMRKQRGQKS